MAIRVIILFYYTLTFVKTIYKLKNKWSESIIAITKTTASQISNKIQFLTHTRACKASKACLVCSKSALNDSSEQTISSPLPTCTALSSDTTKLQGRKTILSMLRQERNAFVKDKTLRKSKLFYVAELTGEKKRSFQEE